MGLEPISEICDKLHDFLMAFSFCDRFHIEHLFYAQGDPLGILPGP